MMKFLGKLALVSVGWQVAAFVFFVAASFCNYIGHP